MPVITRIVAAPEATASSARRMWWTWTLRRPWLLAVLAIVVVAVVLGWVG
jgi:hypothetical protein